MPTDFPQAPRPLPDRPNLRHLKDQAKDLLKDLRKAGQDASLTDAQYKIAQCYGFASWPKLKVHVESLEEIGQLKQAIDSNDLERVKKLMTRNPTLHGAPLGYNKNGPLTWVAECRVPWEPPSATRLAMAEWMIDHGSDVHQGGDGPLMRAALVGSRLPMMDLLVARGADVNAQWNGYFPIIFAPCETVEPAPLKWLLDHGADPNYQQPRSKYPGTALDYVIRTYSRSEQLGQCIDILVEAGCVTRYNLPPVVDLLRGRVDLLRQHLDDDPALIHRRFPELDFGATGYRHLTLRGGTLLHVAAEHGNVEAARLLLERGADVNARATEDELGVGGQTPIFHAVTQFYDYGLPVAQLLVESGADLSVRAKLPGHYEKPDEIVECTPLGYALLFPGGPNESKSAQLLRARGAPE
jgi:ankyrin repeat protein